MSAQSLQVFTLDVPNPEWESTSSSNDAHRINGSISFSFLESFDIQTLANNGANGGNDVTGLLYVPDLEPGDSCINASAPYIPRNVTRQANLPHKAYDLVAMAPWVTSDCALRYMQAARMDPTQGFLFFIPGNTTAIPPDPKDVFWNIDGGDKWKQQNGFPVYAIPGQYGQLLMRESSYYSGNMTQVPYGSDLVQQYDSRDYVRLFADIDLGGNSTSLPSLWVFLLVVLGILLAIIGLTSLSMHWIQRRRRQALRRRVASGEVDLEALGIKRLTVPQEMLSEMPLYTYGTGQAVSQAPQTSGSMTEKKSTGATSTSRPAAAVIRSSSYRPTPLSQPTCAICLDDFVPGETGDEGTTVRELPCQHIFHPECVDTFLRDSSSLCPMCKKTALPKGYCPKMITNAMVRRERMVRQIRERVVVDQTEAGEAGNQGASGLGDRIRTRTMSGLSQFRRGRPSIATPTSEGQQMEQLGDNSPAPPGTLAATTPLAEPNLETASSNQPARPPVQPPSTPGRREWARQRAIAMLGPRAPADPDGEESQRTPTWRKAVRGLFPRR